MIPALVPLMFNSSPLRLSLPKRVIPESTTSTTPLIVSVPEKKASFELPAARTTLLPVLAHPFSAD
jgi:hypothetical protein